MSDYLLAKPTMIIAGNQTVAKFSASSEFRLCDTQCVEGVSLIRISPSLCDTKKFIGQSGKVISADWFIVCASPKALAFDATFECQMALLTKFTVKSLVCRLTSVG